MGGKSFSSQTEIVAYCFFLCGSLSKGSTCRWLLVPSSTMFFFLDYGVEARIRHISSVCSDRDVGMLELFNAI